MKGGAEGFGPHEEATAEARLTAALFDATHQGQTGDVDWYVAQVGGAERVLELGSGSGRVSWPMADAGCEVVGVEWDAGMRALAEAQADRWPPSTRERVRFVGGDMTRLRELWASGALGERKFDVVVVPYNGLWALTDDDAIRRTLEGARAVVAPGGRLRLDVYAVLGPESVGLGGADEAEADGEGADWEGGGDEPVDDVDEDGFRPLITLVLDGRPVDVADREWSGPDDRTVRVDYRYRVRPWEGLPGEEVVVRLNHHFLWAEHVVGALEDAGWHAMALWGGFRNEPFMPDDSESMVLEGTAG